MNKLIIIFALVFLPSFIFSQTITSVTPNSANAGQTLNITITGANTHFAQASGTTVSFGFSQASGTTVNSVTVNSNTSITANVTVPSNTYTGDYIASVYNFTDGNVYMANAVHINGIVQASLSSVSPSTANAGQTLNVTITGANTHFAQASATSISFGFMQGSSTQTYANSVTPISNTSLVANVTVPTNTFSGNYTVYAYNSIDGSMTLYNSFLVNGLATPSITSLSPSSANSGQTLNVTIVGANTHFSQASGTSINFNFNQASTTLPYINSITPISNTSLVANVTIPSNAVTGSYSINAYNSIDGYLSLNNSFYINGVAGPSIASISPANATSGQTLNVTITGANTHFSQASGTTPYLDFGFSQGSATTVINSITVQSNTSIVANITVPSNTASGFYDVYCYTSVDGYLTLSNGFEVYNPFSPDISTLNPPNGLPGQTIDVYITGANMNFMAKSNSTTTVSFVYNQGVPTIINANQVTVTSDTTLIANITIPANATIGNYDIVIQNSSNQIYTLFGAFPIGIVSVSEKERAFVFSLYPNPAKDLLNVQFSKIGNVNTFQIYNLEGKLILQSPIKQDILQVDISKLSKGIYVLKINSDKTVEYSKFVKE